MNKKMALLKLDGFKKFEPQDVIFVNESKFHLDTFKGSKPNEKAEEIASNKVYLGLWKVLKEENLMGYGLGDISRAKKITVDFGQGQVIFIKSKATNSDSNLIGNMSLCCQGEVGQSKFCKKCLKPVEDMGKMVKISKDVNIPIDKEYLEQIRGIRKKPYLLFADSKGLCLSELYYPETVRPHTVDLDGYAITEQEKEVVKEGIKGFEGKKFDVYIDDYIKDIQEYIKNPKKFDVKVVEKKKEKEFSMSDVFGSKKKIAVKNE